MHARIASVTITLLGLGAVLPLAGADEQPTYELPPIVTAEVALPQRLRVGAHFHVEPEVGTSRFFHVFKLKSDYGTYDVTSRYLLEIREHEVETMSRVVGMDGGPEFFKSLGRSLADIPTGAVKFVLNPVEGVKKVGEGVEKTFKRVGDVFRGRQRTPYEDNDVESVFRGEQKRKLAADLGLDVYSSNPQVQRFLDEIANARAAGSLGVDLASFALPVVGFAAVTAARWRAEATQMLRDMTPAELDRANARTLMDLGIPRPTWSRFLGERWLSPRHKTVITSATKQMNGVEGLTSVLDATESVGDETGALFHEQQAALLSYHHTDKESLRRLFRVRHIVMGETVSGKRVVYLPVDQVYWIEDFASLVDQLMEVGESSGEVFDPLAVPGDVAPPEGFHLYVTGRLTTLSRSKLFERGIVVEEIDRQTAEARALPAPGK